MLEAMFSDLREDILLGQGATGEDITQFIDNMNWISQDYGLGYFPTDPNDDYVVWIEKGLFAELESQLMILKENILSEQEEIPVG